MEIFIGVPFGLVAAMALGTWHSYNRLVSLDRSCAKAASEIEAELKARHALAPDLVAAAYDHAGRQRGLVNNLKVASVATRDACEPAAVQRAEAFFSASFVRVVGIVENHPNLRECPRIAELRRDIAERSARIAAARDSFGHAVERYNRALGQFPAKLIGGWLKMSVRDLRAATTAPLAVRT